MTWHVQYKTDGTDLVAYFPTPESAIAAACRSIDYLVEVTGIGTGPLVNSISNVEIAKIHAMGSRPRHLVEGCWRHRGNAAKQEETT